MSLVKKSLGLTSLASIVIGYPAHSQPGAKVYTPARNGLNESATNRFVQNLLNRKLLPAQATSDLIVLEEIWSPKGQPLGAKYRGRGWKAFQAVFDRFVSASYPTAAKCDARPKPLWRDCLFSLKGRGLFGLQLQTRGEQIESVTFAPNVGQYD